MGKLKLPLLLAASILQSGCGILFWLDDEPSAKKAADEQAEDLPQDLNGLMAVADHSQETGTRKGAHMALAALDKAAGLSPDDYEVQWRATRTRFWLAQHGKKELQLGMARQALELAEKLVVMNSHRVEGHYYKATALGLVLRGDPSAGLKRVPEVIASLERAAEIDERFEHAAPRRALGAILLKAPPYPTGPGDLDAALENLERAVTVGPRWPENWLYLAEAKLADRDLGGAKRDAKRALSLLEGMQGMAAATWREQARKLLRKIREKRHRDRDATTF